MKNHLIFIFIMVATFVSCFLPFREINVVSGTYSTLFGTATAVPSVKMESGIELIIPLFSLVFMLIAYLFLQFRHKAWKVIGLIVVVLFLLFQVLLLFVSTFTFNLFGPKTVSTPSIGFYSLVLLAISFSAFYIFVFIRMLKYSSKAKIRTEDQLLDKF